MYKWLATNWMISQNLYIKKMFGEKKSSPNFRKPFTIHSKKKTPSCCGFRWYQRYTAPGGRVRHAMMSWLVGFAGRPTEAREIEVKCCEDGGLLFSW